MMTTMANTRAARQQGFTFIELVIVIILLGLLAAAALPRFLDVTEEAEIASLEGVAGGFSTAVTIAHAQWFAEGNRRGGSAAPADKGFVNLDGSIIYLNENGWPANSEPAKDASYDSQTAEECQEVWNAVLQNPPASTILSSERPNARYFISVLDDNPDICRYELITSNNAAALATHYFDYELGNGTVTVFKPDRT